MDYITIIQGDDTNFLGDQFLVINFNTDIDLSGFTATFSLGDVTLTYGDLSGKNFEVILSDEITSNLKLGKQYGELKLIDTEQRIRTVTSVIPFLVKKGVNEEIKFVNNSLEVSMNINDTVLDVIIETPGIARAEATRIMSYCNDAKVSAQSYANEAHNTHIKLNQDVDIFYENISNLNEIVDNAYKTCENNISSINETRDNTINDVETIGNQKIELATKQADIATQKAQEVSETHTLALYEIDMAKQNSINKIEEKSITVLENFENTKNNTITEFEEKRSRSIDDINILTTACRESLTEIANENLYKWNLFDTVKKDHVLTFEETQGLAQLGTYVYKTGIPGLRYGYPDFYNKCIAEYKDSSNTIINLDDAAITVNSNGHKFYSITDKNKIDEIYNNTAIAWYYGIDEENERIFLPRLINRYLIKKKEPTEVDSTWYNLYSDGWCEQGGNNMPGANYYTVDLPIPYRDEEYTILHAEAYSGANNLNWRAYYDKTPSSFKIYCDYKFDNRWYTCGYTQIPVKQKHIYMVVGNTTTEKAQTETTQVTTSENDTLPLFTGQYFDFKPNHISWLKAGSVANGELYLSTYNELVNILNKIETKYGEGFKVIEESEKDDAADYSEYWVVNQDNRTFRTPLKTSLLNTISNARILIESKQELSEDNNTYKYYNLYSDGWLEQGGYYYKGTSIAGANTVEFLKSYKDTNYIFHRTQLYKDATGSGYEGGEGYPIRTQNTVTFNIVAGFFGYEWTVQGYTYAPIIEQIANSENIGLYFKAANALQNTELIDCGEVLEELNLTVKKSECKAYIIDTYENGTSGYNIYSNGFCEQWGRLTTNSDKVYTITLLKQMKSPDYLCLNTRGVTGAYRNSIYGAYTSEPFNFTTSSFDVWGHSAAGINTIQWEVKGYLP